MAPAIIAIVDDTPPEIELGRALVIARSGLLNKQASLALVIARSGLLNKQASLGIQVLLATAQRRRTIIESGRFHFKDAADGSLYWMVPPYFRKSGSKRGAKFHLVPVEGFSIDAVRKLDTACDVEGGKGWLLPRSADPTIPADINLLNNALDDMPGVEWAPHGVRYALATYGERDLGFSKGEAKVILDHLEGVEQSDVTSSFYSSVPAVKRKREMLQAWCAWLETWAAKAIDADPLLLDREYMTEAIYRKRNGDAALEKRIAYRKARGLPLWPGVESVSDADATEPENQEAAE